MRRKVLTVALLACTLVAVLATQAQAQSSQTARGTISALGADTITVSTADRPMTFMVDAKTLVTASGAGTASREAAAAGKSGPKLAELLKVGEPVEVSYTDMGGGKFHASSIRRTRSVGGPEGPKTETATGTVESVTASSLTITGAGTGGSTFKQTYTIDRDTRVVGRGVGTAASAKEGKVSAPDLVAVGDRVSVSYHKAGDSLHAAEIRVTSRAK